MTSNEVRTPAESQDDLDLTKMPWRRASCYPARVNLFMAKELPMRRRLATLDRKRSRRSIESGFTLTELMVVIVLLSILAALAYPALRKELEHAHGREGIGQMRAIAAAQERFRSEHLTYLNVSPTNALYPNKTPNETRFHFRQPSHEDYTRWEVFAPDIKVPTPYSFISRAGLSGAALPTNPMGLASPTDLPAGPWYYVYGVGDIDGDGIQQRMFFSSFEPELTISNQGE